MAYGRKKKQIDTPGMIMPNKVMFEEVLVRNTHQFAYKHGDEIEVVPFVEAGEIIYNPMIPSPWIIPPPPIKYGSDIALWKDVYQFVYEHLDIMDEDLYEPYVGWVHHTWLVERFDSVPYLHFWGEKNTGKTRALDLLNFLCYRPMLSPSVSGAAVYYAMDYYHPTFLLDEFEMYKDMREAKAEVIGVLNAGYRRGQGVYRVGSVSDDSPTLRRFSVFGPKALSSIQDLPPALDSRCIKIRMARAYRKIKRLIDKNWAEELRGKLLQYRFDHIFDPIPETDNPIDLPDGRLIELYYPIEQVSPTDSIKDVVLKCARKQYDVGIESMRSTFTATIFNDMVDFIEECFNSQGSVPTKMSQQTLRERLNADVREGERGISKQKLASILKRLNFDSDFNDRTRLMEVVLHPDVFERQKTSYVVASELNRVDGVIESLRVAWGQRPTLATLDTLDTVGTGAYVGGSGKDVKTGGNKQENSLHEQSKNKTPNVPSMSTVSTEVNVPNVKGPLLSERLSIMLTVVRSFDKPITDLAIRQKLPWSGEETRKTLETLRRDGMVYNPRPGYWAPTQ